MNVLAVAEPSSWGAYLIVLYSQSDPTTTLFTPLVELHERPSLIGIPTLEDEGTEVPWMIVRIWIIVRAVDLVEVQVTEIQSKPLGTEQVEASKVQDRVLLLASDAVVTRIGGLIELPIHTTEGARPTTGLAVQFDGLDDVKVRKHQYHQALKPTKWGPDGQLVTATEF